MVERQARSAATRRKIIDAAVELFDSAGYTNTGLGDIMETAGVTKGALYHHFTSKEALAVAIIDEGAGMVLKAYRGMGRSSGPALEGMIHAILVVIELANTDKLVRTSAILLKAFGKYSEASALNYRVWLDEIAVQARRAQEEGDLRAELDARVAADFIVCAMLGTELISNAVFGGEDLLPRVTRTWELVLSAIATEQALPYLLQFLSRESLRRGSMLTR